jgi:aerobic carbon-monoxide dehydrogenase medium subunit
MDMVRHNLGGGPDVKPAQFAYHAPTSAGEIIALLAEHGDQARLLAGGQTLMPLMASRKVRSQQVIDLNRVSELAFVTPTGNGLRIGALTRLRQVENDPAVRAAAPLLAAATALAGPVQVRNRATVGGALAYADPAAEYPAVAVALDARVELRGDRVRHLPAAEFFLGAHETALSDTELLAAVEFPSWSEPLAFAIEKIAQRSTGLALAGAVVVLGADTGRLVLFGVAPTPVRSVEAEAALVRGATPDEVADAAVAGLDPPDAQGIRGTTRRTLARGAIARAVATARNKVTHA